MEAKEGKMWPVHEAGYDSGQSILAWQEANVSKPNKESQSNSS